MQKRENWSASRLAQAMDGAYAAMSWDDAAVKAGLPTSQKSHVQEVLLQSANWAVERITRPDT